MIQPSNFREIVLPKYVIIQEKTNDKFPFNNYPRVINVPQTTKIKAYELTNNGCYYF